MGLDDALQQLLNNFGPVTRRSALREIASYFMRSNRKRIRSNVQPGGASMTPRQGRGGRMFRKIGRMMRQQVTADAAQVGFSGRTGWVATNHQLGRVIRNAGQTLHYPVRLLLGADEEDRAAVLAIVLKYIGRGVAA